MITPSVNIKYSRVYDNRFRTQNDYPDKDDVCSFLDYFRKSWIKKEKEILETISKVSNLEWNENNIDIYIVGKTMPFSDPLTIEMTSEIDEAIDVTTHELIHRIWTYDDSGKKAYEYFADKYKKEDKSTIVHVPVIALHIEVMKEIFSKERINESIKRMNKIEGFKHIIKIIELEGSDKIVEEFTLELINYKT
ncbi:MAG: hypothetical protein WCK26_02895 [Candidatus Saccharibacteria bacterium]